MNPYATHQEVLLAACRQAPNGPIVEYGVGDFSTQMLHDNFPDRLIVSVEANMEWMSKFTHLAGPRHYFIHAPDLAFFQLPVRFASVVFVDGDPAPQRRLCVIKHAHEADFIVAHDTEPGCAPAYAWGNCFDGFKFRYNDMRYERWTTVVSNTMSFKP